MHNKQFFLIKHPHFINTFCNTHETFLNKTSHKETVLQVLAESTL
jgi:hypothetical protein